MEKNCIISSSLESRLKSYGIYILEVPCEKKKDEYDDLVWNVNQFYLILKYTEISCKFESLKKNSKCIQILEVLCKTTYTGYDD